jgi:hypothetical protein
MSVNPIHLSTIDPVYNNFRELRECLSALIGSSCSGSEIIFVDGTLWSMLSSHLCLLI